MATGSLDANGIWIYGEDDSETTFSGLLNKLGDSVSDVVANPTVSGNLRLTNDNDVSTTSTNHAFQIGLTSGVNLRMDNNEILVADNGVAATLNINPNADIAMAGTANTVTMNGRWNSLHYPYAVSAGSVTTSTSAAVTVTFPGGGSRFSVAPIITATSATGSSAVTVAYVSSPTATSFGISLYNTAGSRVAQLVHWHAIQMTSSTAGG